jgi:hypothetical protein
MSDAITTLEDAITYFDMGMKHSAIKAVERALQTLQSGEPVARVIDDGTPEGATEWIPCCNRTRSLKAGDLLYATPQPVVPQALIEKVTALCAAVENDEELPPIKWALKCNGLINEVKALLSAGAVAAPQPEMKTYRCVTCNVSGTDDGLCDAHKYDEQLSKHKSAGKERKNG